MPITERSHNINGNVGVIHPDHLQRPRRSRWPLVLPAVALTVAVLCLMIMGFVDLRKSIDSSNSLLNRVSTTCAATIEISMAIALVYFVTLFVKESINR
jgi:hypothetical protein